MDQFVARHQLEIRVFSDAVSEVWHARHIDQPTQRATVRIVDLSRDAYLAGAIESFLADARAASDLVHRNIVQAYDIGDATRPYVLGRFTRAVTWSAHVRDGIGASDAIALLGPLAVALDTAADAGVPHGALHPRSIWVDDLDPRDGAPRAAVLTGFGLHHLLSVVAARPAECRSVDDFLYVAPELLRGAAPSNRSDQYSLAAALQHALTGRPPFEREHLSALFGAHLFGRRPSLDAAASDPGAAAELDRIVGRALAKDPGDRFESCQDFMHAVVDWRMATTGVPVTRVAASSITQPPRPLPTTVHAGVAGTAQRRQSRGVVVLAAAALVAGLLGVFWLARGPMTSGAQLAAAEGTSSLEPAASEAPSTDTSVRWRQQLPSPLTGLQTTAEGPVAITRDGALLLDPTTGDVRANLLAGRTGTVTAGDRIVSADGADLQAVSVADGSVLWRAPVRTVAPTVAGDTVYGVTDEDVPQLVATDAGSGDRLWEFPRDEAAFPADASVAARDDFVYLADGTALYGILPEGAMAGEDTPLITATEAASEPLCLWRHEVDEDMWTSSLRAVDRGVVIANRSGTVCLRGHTDGASAWCVRVPGVADAEPTIYPSDGRVVVVTAAGVTAIDTGSGEVIWSREGTWPRTVLADDRLIAIDREGRAAALSLATGTLTRPTDTTVGVPSALAADGDTLYVGHRDGTVISVDMARGITR